MKKIAICYWSGTGNTQAMAEAVEAGARAAGGDAQLFAAADFDPGQVDTFDAIAFGCPAMGAEELEPEEFEPVFQACEGKLSGKPIALFGSYGWGDGEWMSTWEDTCRSAGANLVCDSVICQETPDDQALSACRSLGAKLAE